MLYNYCVLTNQLKQNIQKIEKAKKILKILNFKGFEAFIVGGAVRDYLLKLNFLDIDIITIALPLDLAKIFLFYNCQVNYGSCKVIFQKQKFDITTYRIEDKYVNHRYPKKIIFIRDVKKDLIRRDFTVNSLLMDYQGNIIDYHDGLADIKNNLICTVGDSEQKFQQDILRILRLFVLQAKTNFKIAKSVYRSLILTKHLLTYISANRILIEFVKILSNQYFLIAFVNLKNTGVIVFLKSLQKGIIFCIRQRPQKMNKNLFFSLSLILDNNVLYDFCFAKQDRKLYQTIQFLFRQQESDLLFLLFEYGLEMILLLNNINYLFGKKYYKINYIKICYENLILKQTKDLKISVLEMLKIVDEKPGIWLKRLQKHLIKLILYRKIANNRFELLNYIKKLGVKMINEFKDYR